MLQFGVHLFDMHLKDALDSSELSLWDLKHKCEVFLRNHISFRIHLDKRALDVNLTPTKRMFLQF